MTKPRKSSKNRRTHQPHRPNAFAKVHAAVRHGVDLRDQRDDALKSAAAALAILEAMVESGTVDQADINAAEGAYEAKVDALVKLETAMKAACNEMVAQCYTAVLVSTDRNNMPKA
jgi:hypothetical protein